MGIKMCQCGAEKISVVNYLSKPPPQNDEFYYEEDSYAVNDQTGGSNRVPKAQIRRIGAKVQKTKVGSMVTRTVRVIMYDMEVTPRQQLQQG